MHAVVNRLRLARPIDPAVFEAAQRDLPARAAQIEGLRAFHVLRAGDDELLLLILGDTPEALERMRSEVGNDWMVENIVPHLAGGTERTVGEAVVSWDRA
jgi:hypothetical protein